MIVNSSVRVTIAEADKDFSKLASIVDELGAVVITKNDRPKYVVIDSSLVTLTMDYDGEEAATDIGREIQARKKKARDTLKKDKD